MEGWCKSVAILAQARANLAQMRPQKRRIAAVAPTPDGGAEEWRRHPRLRRHVTRFRSNKHPEGVLNRYRRRAAGASHREPPFRDMTHVAAWVSGLPSEAALLPDCARLLSLFLRRHPCGASLEELREEASSDDRLWLRGTLHLVALRLKELRKETPGGLAEHWLGLQRSMPRSVWRLLRTSCPAIDTVCKEAEQHGTVDEGAHHGPEAHPGREAEVKAVLQEATASLESGDADRMLNAVSEAVAMLTAPRKAAVQEEGAETMTEAALDRLRAAQQSRLRKVLLRLLGEGLDLSDPGTLQLLRAPLEKLNSLLGGQCLSSCAHANQWVALARVVGVPHGDGGATLQLDAPPSRTGADPSSHSGGPPASWTRGQKRESGRYADVKTLALAAMASLGGQATSKQLREEMARMPESSRLNSELCAASSEERTGVNVWEKHVVEQMRFWFERSETPRVFRLKGSGDGPSPASWSWNSGLMAMALAAMANLGGQATLKQIKEEISMLPESSRLSSQMATTRSKQKMWHVSLANKMSHWFERTGTPARLGSTAYRLRGSART